MRVSAPLWLLGVAFVAACGGGTSPAPTPLASAPLGGQGVIVPLNAHVTFTVIVPPATTLASVGSVARKHGLASGPVTNPYVSPNTASVTVQLQTVNGQSLLQVPPPVVLNIPAGCIGSTAGCTVPLSNVAAAKGVDRFNVETFSQQNGLGNLISSSFVDINVPSPQGAALGGTALTIGGFAAAIVLTLTPPGGHFVVGSSSTAGIDVNAVDPAGAFIIGNSILASPIVVSLPPADGGYFTLNGGSAVTLTQPAQTLTLAYNGKLISAAQINASTVDENGNAVSVTVPLTVGPKPTPAPTPTSPGATPPPPLSIYVDDGAQDQILEYDGVRGIESLQAPNPTETPHRAFQFAVDPTTYSNCSLGNFASFPDVGGIAVSPSGTIYAETACTDPSASQSYTFTYSATTVQSATPPPAVPAFSVNSASTNNPGVAVQPLGVKLDSVHGLAFVGYSNEAAGGAHIVSVLTASAQTVSNLAESCITELGAPGTCGAPDPNFPFSFQYSYLGQSNFAVDANDVAYVPTAYVDQAPGPAASQFPNEPAVVALNASAAGTNRTPTPLSALAGQPDELGGGSAGGAIPPDVAIEGANFYALSSTLAFTNTSGVNIDPGLSGCPPPSSSAPVDSVDTTGYGSCADQTLHTYLVGFPSGTLATLLGAAGQDVIVPPKFLLGGDVIGGFGTSNSGDIVTVFDGFAYVVNNAPTLGNTAAEIDVYDVRTISGSHTDIPPIARIKLPSNVVGASIAIGPTGPASGWVPLLRKSHARHDLRAWLRKGRTLKRTQSLRRY